MFARWGWLFVFAAAVGLASCSSDEFGSVGGRLPLDAGQDSLLVSLTPALTPIVAESFEPAEVDSFAARELLYLGNDDQGPWRATPLIHIDFSAGLPAEFDSSSFSRAELQINALDIVKDKQLTRAIRLYELANPLSVDDAAVADVQTLLGDPVGDFDFLASSKVTFELSVPQVLEWVESGAHNGFALYDLAPSLALVDSTNFWPLAAQGFTDYDLVPDALVGEIIEPEIKLFITGSSPPETVDYPVDLDLTHLERPDFGDDLEFGTHIAKRLFFQFDLQNSGVPGNATVNEAVLTLHVNRGPSMGEAPSGLTVRAYEATMAQALDTAITDLERVLRSSSEGNLRLADSLQVDVTDFVQRAINLVVDEDVGLVLSFLDSELYLNLLDVYGTSAPAGLRPRLDILFTPPADYWR